MARARVSGVDVYLMSVSGRPWVKFHRGGRESRHVNPSTASLKRLAYACNMAQGELFVWSAGWSWAGEEHIVESDEALAFVVTL